MPGEGVLSSSAANFWHRRRTFGAFLLSVSAISLGLDALTCWSSARGCEICSGWMIWVSKSVVVSTRKYLPSRVSVAGRLVVVTATFFRPRSLPVVSEVALLGLVPVSIATRLGGRCGISLLLSWLRSDSVLPVVVAEFLFDLFLNWHGDSREKSAEPVQLHQKLSAHLSDRENLAAASFHVDFFFVLQKFFVPIEQVGGRCRVSDVHEAKSSNVRWIGVFDEAVYLLACQLQGV